MKRRKKRIRDDQDIQQLQPNPENDEKEDGQEQDKAQEQKQKQTIDQDAGDAGDDLQKHNVHVVKCKLGRCKLQSGQHIWDKIEDLVKITSQTVYHASHLANLFVLYALQNGENPFDNGTKIQTWFTHWMRIVLDQFDKNIHPSWVDFVQQLEIQCPLVENQVTVKEKPDESRPNRKKGQPAPPAYVSATRPWDAIDLGNILYSMSRDLKTNFENSLFIPFNQRLKSTLKAQLRAHGIEVHASSLDHLRSYLRRHCPLYKNRVTFKKISEISYTKKQQEDIDGNVFTSTWNTLVKLLNEHEAVLREHPGIGHRSGLKDNALKQHPYYTIKYLFYLQKVRQSLNISNFTLLPVRKMKRQSIEVDTRLLFNIFQTFYPENLDDLNVTNELQFNEYKEECWNILLDVRQFETSKKKFPYTSIRTDGVQICVPLLSAIVTDDHDDINRDDTLPNKRRKMTHASPAVYNTTLRQACQKIQKEYVENVNGRQLQRKPNVIGVDEGRGVLLATYNNLDKTSHTLTNHQYRKYSGITKRIKRQQDWVKGQPLLKAAMDLVSQQQYKTADWRQYFSFLRVQWSVYDVLWRAAVAPRHSNENFRVYRFRSACIDNFLHHVFDEYPTASVAYGDATFNAAGKGQLSAPTSWLSKRVQLFFTQQNRRRGYNNVVVEVDEYNTSKFCHKCHSRLEKSDKSDRCRSAMSARFVSWGLVGEGDPSVDKVRRSLCWRFSWCGTPGCEKLRHRDKNAAANMALLLTGYIETLCLRRYRPLVFRRPVRCEVVPDGPTDPTVSTTTDPALPVPPLSPRVGPASGLRLVNLRSFDYVVCSELSL